MRRFLVTAAGGVSLMLAMLAAACGGGGGSEADVEAAIRDYFADPDVQFDVGLNLDGTIVGVHKDVGSYFSGGDKRFSDVEVSDIGFVEGDDDLIEAGAVVTFQMTVGVLALRCESSVGLQRDGPWRPLIFTVASCDEIEGGG